MSRGMRRVVVISIVVVVFAIAIIPRLLSTREDTVKDVVAASVETDNPIRGVMERSISFPGNLQPETTITILSKIAGTVERILIQEGESILKDDPVCRLNSDIVALQSQAAYAAWQAAQAQYDLAVRGVREEEKENAQALVDQADEDLVIAEKNLARTKELYEAGATSARNYEEAENQIRAARTQLENAKRNIKMMELGASEEELTMARSNADAAKAQYELAKLQLEYATVRSPGSGIVAKVMIEEGNMISTSMPICVVVQDDPILAVIPVPEKYYNDVLGREEEIEVRVNIANNDAEVIMGEIISISPTISAESRTFDIEIAINNPDRLLRPGMYINAELVIQKITDVLMVPNSAIVWRDEQQVVYLLDGAEGLNQGISPVTQVIVKTGLVQDGFSQIISSRLSSGQSASETDRVLDENSLIVIHGNAFLEDGQMVRQVLVAGRDD